MWFTSYVLSVRTLKKSQKINRSILINILKIQKMRLLKISFSILLILLSKQTLANMTVRNAHQFSFSDIEGKKLNLSDFDGKAILVVNTASKCGFTPQYQDLEALYKKYKDRGLVVIGVPSADFGGQEFAQEAQVKEFTDEKFQISFPITSINQVKGENAHPFYNWANDKAGFIGSPKWNFHKYLIDKDGNFVSWYSSATKPTSSKITKKVEELLSQ